MCALKLAATAVFSALGLRGISPFDTSSDASTMSSDDTHLVVTDLTVSFCSPTDSSSCALGPVQWRRIEKDLHLHSADESAWLQVQHKREEHLTADDLIITEINVSEQPVVTGLDDRWETRPGGIWIRLSNYTGESHKAVTDVDVLFGLDSVDPRPQWSLLSNPLLLHTGLEVPVARLSVRYGRPEPRSAGRQPALRAREDGLFKIVQISDTHMVTGVGWCEDAIDASGELLPPSAADPLSIQFLERILDVEKPDLVIFTGDQIHHDVLDSQSVLLKLVAPLIKRSIPYAAVFGNHDSEGSWALSRTAQMALLQDLPFSLCATGLAHVDGVGNYYLQVLPPAPSELPALTLYLLDSHSEIPSKVKNPDYYWIKQSQIDWFTHTAQALREVREEAKSGHEDPAHTSLAFMHIPLPEYADGDLVMTGGHRREPTEGPSFNSRFYDVLSHAGVAAVGCGHDHVNDFCALRPQPQSELQGDGGVANLKGPWLCHAGGSGFGGYGSYGGKYYHRRARVWEVDTTSGGIKTWKRVEYAEERVDEVVLVKDSKVVAPPPSIDGIAGETAQAVL